MVEKINAIYDSTVLKGFVVRPGHENLVAMTAVNTIADEAIRDVPPEKRNCYFQDEYKLDMYQLYSQSGCIFECKMRIGQSKTEGGCTPWFYPTRGEQMIITNLHKSFVTKLISCQTRTCVTRGRPRCSCQQSWMEDQVRRRSLPMTCHYDPPPPDHHDMSLRPS